MPKFNFLYMKSTFAKFRNYYLALNKKQRQVNGRIAEYVIFSIK